MFFIIVCWDKIGNCVSYIFTNTHTQLFKKYSQVNIKEIQISLLCTVKGISSPGCGVQTLRWLPWYVLYYCTAKKSSKHLYWPWQIIVPMSLILLQSVTFVYLFIYQTNFYEFSFQVSETWNEHNKLLYVEFMVSVTCCTLFHLSFKCIYPILLSTPYLAPSFGADKKMILLS